MTTRTLVLVRHAKAQGSSTSGDRGRHLTPEGRDQARRLGLEVAEVLPRIDTAVVSPAERARETLEQIAEAVDLRRQWVDDSLYLAGVEAVVEIARSLTGDTAVLVGHEPTISSAATVLAATREDREEVGLGVPTATAVILGFEGEWADLDEGACTLRLLHAPVHPTR
ncbi:histidine phosphatase family protein [Actinomyces sp.]|uniref:SixA phosphatase family protein n=1 Tax=Actinomyces sp. TaxID=29317 RepID=UPI0028968B67|nr:histidine phosphatase family protein [Actinomyces sp.]